MTELIYKEITEKIIGASMRVHSTPGNGFQGVIYQRALAIELEKSGVMFSREFNMPIYYDGKMIGERRVDFLIDDKISVELKATLKLEPVLFAEARNYLEAYNPEVGLLINFGSICLEFKRLQNSKFKPTNLPPNH